MLTHKQDSATPQHVLYGLVKVCLVVKLGAVVTSIVTTQE